MEKKVIISLKAALLEEIFSPQLLYDIKTVSFWFSRFLECQKIKGIARLD